jgi:hypothetical protein
LFQVGQPRLAAIASEFGFKPASRSGISTPSANERTLFDILDHPDAEG